MGISVEEAVKELRNRDEVFVAYSQATKLPYVTCDEETFNDQARIFATEEEIKEYGKKLLEDKVLLMGMKYEKKDFPRLYGTLYAIGVNSVIWTDGEEQIEVEIGRIASQRDMSKIEPSKRPEAGLLKIRKGLELYANIRPAILFDELSGACPLKEELTEGGFDFVVMRELTGGLYFGERKTIEENGVKKAIDTLTYDENEIRRIAKWGFDVAMKRNKKVCSVDKANVLDSSRLWRSVVAEVAKDYPEVELTNMLVDNCAMQLVRDPKQFDVILTENMFGDILSDEASMVTGSIGMLSSASLGATKLGLYEPSHGSAPDIAGQDIANPIATILSAAMMLRYSFDLEKEADAIEDAVKKVLAEGYRTVDIMDEGKTRVGTTKMGDLIAERIG